MKANFVIFESPGTFFHETTERPIQDWNVTAATEMARTITERHNAKPFAFYFTTRERKDDELDSKKVAESGRYFLGGKIETIEEVRHRADPEESILLGNMESNGWDRIIVNTNSLKVVQPFTKDDVLLEWELSPTPA